MAKPRLLPVVSFGFLFFCLFFLSSVKNILCEEDGLRSQIGRMHKQIVLSSSSPDGNIMFSPYSVLTALNMLLIGAKGRTYEEISNFFNNLSPVNIANKLSFGEESKSILPTNQQVNVTTANRLYVDEESFKENKNVTLYADLINEYYLNIGDDNTDSNLVEYANFTQNHEKARKDINSWVSEKTNHLIRELLSEGSVTRATRLILVNAVYFAARWRDKFNAERHLSPFAGLKNIQEIKYMSTTLPSRCVMDRSAFPLRRCRGSGGVGTYKYVNNSTGLMSNITIVEIPYNNPHYTLTIFKPEDPSLILDVEDMLNRDANLADKLVKNIYYENEENDENDENDSDGLTSQIKYKIGGKVELRVPMFEVDSSLNKADMKKVLKSLNIEDAFKSSADFSGITGKNDLHVDEVVHKAFVKVNEKGTEAAAATGVGMMFMSLPLPPSKTISIDSSFIMQIRGRRTDSSSGNPEDDVIIFQGRITDIKATKERRLNEEEEEKKEEKEKEEEKETSEVYNASEKAEWDGSEEVKEKIDEKKAEKKEDTPADKKDMKQTTGEEDCRL